MKASSGLYVSDDLIARRPDSSAVIHTWMAVFTILFIMSLEGLVLLVLLVLLADSHIRKVWLEALPSTWWWVLWHTDVLMYFHRLLMATVINEHHSPPEQEHFNLEVNEFCPDVAVWEARWLLSGVHFSLVAANALKQYFTHHNNLWIMMDRELDGSNY